MCVGEYGCACTCVGVGCVGIYVCVMCVWGRVWGCVCRGMCMCVLLVVGALKTLADVLLLMAGALGRAVRGG